MQTPAPEPHLPHCEPQSSRRGVVTANKVQGTCEGRIPTAGKGWTRLPTGDPGAWSEGAPWTRSPPNDLSPDVVSLLPVAQRLDAPSVPFPPGRAQTSKPGPQPSCPRRPPRRSSGISWCQQPGAVLERSVVHTAACGIFNTRARSPPPPASTLPCPPSAVGMKPTCRRDPQAIQSGPAALLTHSLGLTRLSVPQT